MIRTQIACCTLPLMLLLSACDDEPEAPPVVVVPPPTPTPAPTPAPTGFNVTNCLTQTIPGAGTTVAGASCPTH